MLMGSVRLFLQVPKLAKELSDLVAYCQATHFKNFEYSREQGKLLFTYVQAVCNFYTNITILEDCTIQKHQPICTAILEVMTLFLYAV